MQAVASQVGYRGWGGCCVHSPFFPSKINSFPVKLSFFSFFFFFFILSSFIFFQLLFPSLSSFPPSFPFPLLFLFSLRNPSFFPLGSVDFPLSASRWSSTPACYATVGLIPIGTNYIDKNLKGNGQRRITFVQVPCTEQVRRILCFKDEI